MALIKGHPDLAGKAAREGAMTADSKFEQSSAGLDRLTEEEFADFHRLNNAYRAKFDMPFIVCVRRHGKESILRQFERRLAQRRATAERETALTEIFRIAALRLDQRVAAADRLKVHGRLSTHVLDTHRGSPRRRRSDRIVRNRLVGNARLIGGTITNADGRTDRPLIAEQPMPIAKYELRFAVGDVFRAARHAGRRSAISRYRADPFRGRRARGALSRSASGHAVELFHLSRQLSFTEACGSNRLLHGTGPSIF